MDPVKQMDASCCSRKCLAVYWKRNDQLLGWSWSLFNEQLSGGLFHKPFEEICASQIGFIFTKLFLTQKMKHLIEKNETT